MSCSVRGCGNIKRFKPTGITFHRFPRGPLLQTWLEILGISPDWHWSPAKFVCSKHFTGNDFAKGPKAIHLKANAVPTLYLHRSQSQPQIHQFAVPSTSRQLEEKQISVGVSRSSSQSPVSSGSGITKRLRTGVKRHLSASSESQRSSDSSTRRKRVKLIQEMHNYCISSPGQIKRKYIQLQKKGLRSRRQLYKATSTIKQLKKKVFNLESVISELRQMQTVSENGLSHLEKCVEGIPTILMRRYLKTVRRKKISREKYPEQLRDFALTLHFYSPKAYNYVRKTFALALPHPSVLRSWCTNVQCEPGFCDICFDVIKAKAQDAANNSRPLIVSLMLDETAIKKQIESDGKKIWGYIDIGVSLNNDDLQVATEALVLMVVCHTAHWKLPIGYFFIKSLTGSERAALVQEAVTRLHAIHVEVTSVTCDGPSVHFSMLKELGCSLEDALNMVTYFPHPCDSNIKLFAILDVCHMLKLIRNLLATLMQIKTRDGTVSWAYIKKLYEVQDSETVTLANKLKKSHIDWHRQKMKVNLAAQTFSASVAEAIEFLNKELQHPDFEGSEATVAFIRRINNLFDLLNSRSPWGKGFQAPLKADNQNLWRLFLVDCCSFLLDCTDVGGRPLYMTPRKTSILGFVISIKSVMGIFDEFVASQKLNYLLTYKCSQDHLEIFFCSIRSRNGWNNNPSCLQFMRTFRKLLLFAPTGERGGNCKVLDDTLVLKVASTPSKQDLHLDLVDVALGRKYNLLEVEEAQDHDYAVPFVALNALTENVVTYISGYVIQMLRRVHKCADCIDGCLLASTTVDLNTMPSYRFLNFKNKGGLQTPALGVVKICEGTERAIRLLMIHTSNKLPSDKLFFTTFNTLVAQKFYSKVYLLFPHLEAHSLSYVDHDNHLIILVKKIVYCYSRIRFFSLAKRYTVAIQGTNVRRVLTKLILFNHQ